MATPDYYHGVQRSHTIQVISIWKALLKKLTFMPITVGHDDGPRGQFTGPPSYRSSNVLE
jgi:hypothetical protein